MPAWSLLTAVVAPLRRDDVDTDVIIPQTELVVTTADGLAGGLFAGWRYDEQRRERPDFVLNIPRYRSARILVAGRNFGCGSSREHAVWALSDYGFRCVLAPSFGAIFYRNCLRSQVAPLRVDAGTLDAVVAEADGGTEPRPLTVDLVAGRLSVGDSAWVADVPDEVTRYVVDGLDEVGTTLRLAGAIEEFERRRDGTPLGRLLASSARVR
jgi:3-isopropylmalate/(R)-2-methylmalate dehydratase small subunit